MEPVSFITCGAAGNHRCDSNVLVPTTQEAVGRLSPFKALCSQDPSNTKAIKLFLIPTHLPMSRNSPTRPWRRIAMRRLRTVIPSQKHATTLALGRWALSRSSSRSKLCSPALLQILPGGIIQTVNGGKKRMTLQSNPL